jgi:hypothetical protein
MPINWKDYTPIPWGKKGEGGKVNALPPLETQPLVEKAPDNRLASHHHRLKKIFHLSHKLYLKFL